MMEELDKYEIGISNMLDVIAVIKEHGYTEALAALIGDELKLAVPNIDELTSDEERVGELLVATEGALGNMLKKLSDVWTKNFKKAESAHKAMIISHKGSDHATMDAVDFGKISTYGYDKARFNASLKILPKMADIIDKIDNIDFDSIWDQPKSEVKDYGAKMFDKVVVMLKEGTHPASGLHWDGKKQRASLAPNKEFRKDQTMDELGIRPADINDFVKKLGTFLAVLAKLRTNFSSIHKKHFETGSQRATSYQEQGLVYIDTVHESMGLALRAYHLCVQVFSNLVTQIKMTCDRAKK